MVKYLPVLFVSFWLSAAAVAAETGETKIKSIASTFKGVTVILENNNHNISNCNGAYADKQIYLIPTADEYSTISSYLLSAFMAEKKVNIVSVSCTSDGYSSVRDVVIVNTP